MASDVTDQSDTPDGRWIMPTTGGQYAVNGQTVVYSGYNWIYDFLNYGAMSGKFAVGEFYDGSVSNVGNWISAEPNRSSAFGFPLKFNYLNPMCNNPGSFNMSTPNGAGLVAANRGGVVTFVENHDIDGSSNAITQDKLLAHAYILASQGHPCVYCRGWSIDSGSYGSGLQVGINNLIRIHEKIANGSATQRRSNSQIYVSERTGGSHLPVGMSDNTGYEPDVYTDGSGSPTISIPADSSGASYVAYSVSGITGSFAPTVGATTQEYDGAQDLDIKPADSTQYVTAAQIEVNAGSSIGGSLCYSANGWTAGTNISLQLLSATGAVLKIGAYTSSAAQGASLIGTAAAPGLYTFQIRSNSTPSSNLKPAYSLKASYTAPPTVIPVNFSVANAATSGSRQIYVCGNDTDLGNFTLANAFLLDSNGSNNWSSEIALSASTAIRYKYVKWNGATAAWEADQNTTSGNRQIITPSQGALIENNGEF